MQPPNLGRQGTVLCLLTLFLNISEYALTGQKEEAENRPLSTVHKIFMEIKTKTANIIALSALYCAKIVAFVYYTANITKT